MNNGKRLGRVVAVFAGLLLGSFSARAQQEEPPKLEKVDFRDLELSEACRLLADQTGLNLVPSAAASSTKVSIFLRNVPAMAAVETLCKAHQLWFQRDAKTGIIRINTVKEYKKDLITFQEVKTEFFTLLYPNAMDVAYAVRNLFPDRVILRPGDADSEMMMELSMRLARFDIIDSRLQGLGGQGQSGFGGGQFGGGQLGGGQYGGGQYGGGYGRGQYGGGVYGGGMYGGGQFGGGLYGGGTGYGNQQGQNSQQQNRERQKLDVDADEIQQLEKIIAGAKLEEGERDALLETLSRRQQASIYVTVAKRQNKLVVRTGDEQAMAQIRTLVDRLDVPTSLVLLEVRVLSIDLVDDLSSFFEYQWAKNKTAGSFGLGNILPPAPGTLGPGGTGLNAGNLIFQFVDTNFAARLQLLQTKNRVRLLSTPILLTANNEVSRLFVGREVPLNRSFAGGQAIANQTTTTTTPGTTNIEFRPVGTSLLITPNINSDRTVTLRIVQETSDVTSTATVLVPTDTGFTPQEVNVVSSQSVSGTIVAKSELAVAFGGLIEKGKTDENEQVPILGDIPLIGFLFKRRVDRDTRREIVIVVRPYVLSTPAESEAASHGLLDKLGANVRALDVKPYAGNSERPGEPVPPGLSTFKIFGFDTEDP